MMHVKDIRRRNLRVLARAVGGVTQLANRLEKSQSQVSHLIGSNPVKNIGDKFAAEVERAFDKPLGWLDHEHSVIEEEGARYIVENEQPFFAKVPLVSWQNINEWLLKPNLASTKTHPQYYIVNVKVSHHTFALRVDGDSMEAPHGVSFPNNSIIIVDPETPAYNGAYVLAKQMPSSQMVFKQLVLDGSRRYLKPLNPRYPIIEISPQTHICGIVKLMMLEFK
jgi:SOS-response transcriptional repressor LexA